MPELMSASEKKELVKEIKDKCVQTGSFKLASGGTSTFFFDMKKATLDPKASKIITRIMLRVIAKENVRYIGGMESGAIPIVSELCLESDDKSPLYAFFVKKSNDGRNPPIEGNFKEGVKVLLVEDVTTKGGSILNAVKAVRARGCTVEKVVTIVDRLDNARENLKKEGIELIALTDQTDYADKIDASLNKKRV